MKVIILLLSMALVSVAQVDPPPRSVKVALETSFHFDPKDTNDNDSFVDNIKGFLNKLYKILEPAQKQEHYRAEAEQQDNEGSPNFIEILKNIGNHFVNLADGKTKGAVNTIQVAKIAENKRRMAKIKEIVPDEKIEETRNNPEEMKRMINSTMTEDSTLKREPFARRTNTNYNDEDIKQLNKILEKFRRNFESVIDNSKAIKELLDSTIFKKYNRLNESAKGALLSDLKMLSGFLIAKNMFSGLNENPSVLTRRNSPTQDDDAAGFDEADMTYTALSRSIDKKLRDAREKKAEKKMAREAELL